MNHYKTIHPGVILKAELIRRKISQKDFASLIGMPPPVLNDIINERRNITPDIAVLLEEVLYKSAYYWLSLQNDRDIEIAKNKPDYINKVRLMNNWSEIQWCCNPCYIQKYIDGSWRSSINQKIEAILNFFKVNTIDDLHILHNRMFENFTNYPYEVLFNRNDLFSLYHIALHLNDLSTLSIGNFDKNKYESIVNSIKTIIYENKNTINRITDVLTQNGIKPFFIHNIKDSIFEGLSFWQNNTPIILIIIPEMKIDKLAFQLLHELYHVFKCHDRRKKVSLCLSTEEDLSTPQEKKAYDYVTEQLFPTIEWQLFKGLILHENKYMTHELINDFSKHYHIHPAIVLQRFKRDFDVNYKDTGFEMMIK